MAFKKDEEFKYSFRGFNHIVDEKGNQFIRFAQIAWAGEDEEVDPSKIKIDIRKYTTDQDGKEKMLKGVSFLTEEGPNELTHALVEEGFGNTCKVFTALKGRDDFKDAVREAYGEKVNDLDDETFDLRDIL